MQKHSPSTASAPRVAPAMGGQAQPYRRPTLFDRVHVTFIAAYIAFAGIYWLPIVSHDLISKIKIALFAAFVAIGILRFKLRSQKQFAIFFWLAVCAAGAFLANSMTSDTNIAIDQARNFIEPLLWHIALYGIHPRAYPLLLSRLKAGLTVFFLMAIYPIGVYLTILPNFYAPGALVDPLGANLDNEWVRAATSIVGGGFNGGSTGWGATVAPAALMASALYLVGRTTTNRARIIAAIIIAGSTASIIVTGARGGTMALLAVVAYSVAIARGIRVSGLVVVGGFLLLLISIDLAAFLPEKFLRNFDTSGDLYTRLNALSTGRLEGYVGGLNHFIESPLIGKGPLDAKVWVNNGREHGNIHNVWVRQMAESGIFLILPLLFLTRHIVLLALIKTNAGKAPRNDKLPTWPDTRMAILCGLIMALVEPSVLIGSFNASAVIWTAIWFEMARPRYRTPLFVRTR